MNISDLAPLAILLVIAAIVISVGSDILNTVRDSYTTTGGFGCNNTDPSNCSYAYNTSSSSLEGLEKVADWQSTIGLIISAAIVIGIIMTAFR